MQDDSNLGGYYGSFQESAFGDMQKQESDSLAKRLEPANPALFIANVSEIIRNHNSKYSVIGQKYKLILDENNAIIVGLKRLETMSGSGQRITLNDIRESYRELVEKGSGIGYDLSRCKRILDDVTTTVQLIGETFKNPLADKQKKVGMQQELSLRIGDITDQFNRCEKAVNDYGALQQGLREKIKEMTDKMNVTLPAEVKKQLDHNEAIQKLVLEKQKEYGKKPSPKPESKPSSKTPSKPEKAKPEVKKPKSLVPGGAKVLSDLNEEVSFLNTWTGRASVVVVGALLGFIAAEATKK